MYLFFSEKDIKKYYFKLLLFKIKIKIENCYMLTAILVRTLNV